MSAADPKVPTAVAAGGPMDGALLGSADVPQFEVVMADRSRWVYAATGERCELADGAPALVYRCSGRR